MLPIILNYTEDAAKTYEHAYNLGRPHWLPINQIAEQSRPKRVSLEYYDQQGEGYELQACIDQE